MADHCKFVLQKYCFFFDKYLPTKSTNARYYVLCPIISRERKISFFSPHTELTINCDAFGPLSDLRGEFPVLAANEIDRAGVVIVHEKVAGFAPGQRKGKVS